MTRWARCDTVLAAKRSTGVRLGISRKRSSFARVGERIDVMILEIEVASHPWRVMTVRLVLSCFIWLSVGASALDAQSAQLRVGKPARLLIVGPPDSLSRRITGDVQRQFSEARWAAHVRVIPQREIDYLWMQNHPPPSSFTVGEHLENAKLLRADIVIGITIVRHAKGVRAHAQIVVPGPPTASTRLRTAVLAPRNVIQPLLRAILADSVFSSAAGLRASRSAP